MAEEDRGSACDSWPAQLGIYPWALLNLQPPRAEKNYKWNRLQSCLFGVLRLHNPSWKHIWQGLRRNVNSIFPLQVHLLSQHSVDLSLISSSDSSSLFVCGHALHMDASQSIECSKARPKRKSPVGLREWAAVHQGTPSPQLLSSATMPQWRLWTWYTIFSYTAK